MTSRFRYGLPLVGSLRSVLLLSIERVRSCGYPSVETTRGTVYFDGEPPRPSARQAASGMDCPSSARFQTCVSYRSENARPCGYPACSSTRSAVVFNGEGARMAGRQRSSARGQLPRQPVKALCISTVRASRQSLDQRVQARCPAGKLTLAPVYSNGERRRRTAETRGFRCGYPPPKSTRRSVNFNGERPACRFLMWISRPRRHSKRCAIER